MKFSTTELEGVWLIEPERHRDRRGYFCETFRADLFEAATGVRPCFVQENESQSCRNVVRGLHYQAGDAAQAKLVRVSEGAIVDVAVDLRPGSPTYGRHICVELSEENGRQLYIPRGFAHGFAVLSESARFQYKTDNYYCPEAERTIRPDDATIGVAWPIPKADMILSEKDLAGKTLKEINNDTSL
ncbi:MAG: dTDP-4-dehydrorhamnose 3,5-epimerase [Muribaculaceae bacterium]|nr:dTDP-4-dehydrorhamnose 3,5-epimerase [Muribaculaceae bacterium]